MKKVKQDAKMYDIPQNELTVDVYNDAQRQKDMVQVSFRVPSSMDKYGGEIAVDAGHGVPNGIVERQIQNLLRQLEQAWLDEGGRVTFYKGHGFFYRYKSDMGKACLEVQCTVCQHMELINKPSEVLDEYRDVFLMSLLPKADRNCDCHHSRYEAADPETIERFI